MGLRRDVSLDQLPGCRVERDLAGEEHEAPRLDGLGVRPDRGWRRRRGDGVPHYAAFTTLPERRHRVQTRSRLTPPLIIARTRWRFGSNRRGLTLYAWLM